MELAAVENRIDPFNSMLKFYFHIRLHHQKLVPNHQNGSKWKRRRRERKKKKKKSRRRRSFCSCCHHCRRSRRRRRRRCKLRPSEHLYCTKASKSVDRGFSTSYNWVEILILRLGNWQLFGRVLSLPSPSPLIHITAVLFNRMCVYRGNIIYYQIYLTSSSIFASINFHMETASGRQSLSPV